MQSEFLIGLSLEPETIIAAYRESELSWFVAFHWLFWSHSEVWSNTFIGISLRRDVTEELHYKFVMYSWNAIEWYHTIIENRDTLQYSIFFEISRHFENKKKVECPAQNIWQKHIHK